MMQRWRWRTAYFILCAAMAVAVSIRAAAGFDVEKIVRSRQSVSNEFRPVDDAVEMVCKNVPVGASVCYVVDDAENIDGADRATFAGIAFRLASHTLHLGDERLLQPEFDFYLFDNYSPAKEEFANKFSQYAQIAKTGAFALYSRLDRNQDSLLDRFRAPSAFVIARQLLSAFVLLAVSCLGVVRLSGIRPRLDNIQWIVFLPLLGFP